MARHVRRLAGEGLFDLDEALDVDLAVLGAVPDPRWRLVTARRVLTHTSGLPNWRGPAESARAAGVNIPVTSEVPAGGADEIFTPSVLLDEERGRSLGWGTVRTAAGQIAWQHGDNRGFKHIAGLRRDRGDGIVMFTNGEDGSACQRFFSQVLGASPW